MRNGISAYIDPSLHNLLLSIQKERFELGIDKKKKSLTEISHIFFQALVLQKNMERLLKIRYKI